MATYLMLGTLTQEARKAVSAKRTEDAMALIKKHGGEFKAGYALLGEVDFVVVLDLPDIERAIQVSMGLSRLLDINFRTAPAVSIDEFDRLASV
ncbi:MAG: GYD domain-containing protein [Thiobacillaceae bacterium]